MPTGPLTRSWELVVLGALTKLLLVELLLAVVVVVA